MARSAEEVRKLLDILVAYGLRPEFAVAVEDPGRLFGHSVSDKLISDVNEVSKALYQSP